MSDSRNLNKINRISYPPILQTGFRIFFLGAALYAVVSMVFWKMFYVMGQNIFVTMPLTVWHGHEMIFGFTMAVVAGFLLTAVQNWTGLPTVQGLPLLTLFVLWLLGRVFAFMPSSVPMWPVIVSNILFLFLLSVAVIRPIIKVKQWKQSAVFSKLLLILISGIVFYVALSNSDFLTERKALRFALYMIISLIFTIGRRVIPFFIERGVGYAVELRNSRLLDMISLICLVAFSLVDIYWPAPWVIVSLCVVLTISHILRLIGWHTYGVWKKPLLWVLFVGYIFLITGFVLKIFSIFGHRSDDAAVHAWTAGGIGIFTLGMMARVTWGHTGRMIDHPPRSLSFMFGLMIIGAVVRTFFPLFFQQQYFIWIAISQVLWILAFGFYLIRYFNILVSPRPDGKWG